MASVITKLSEFPTTDHKPAQSSVTLLLPRLVGWSQQLQPGLRYPQLERFFARARLSPALADSLDTLRLKLFGIDSLDGQPVAALAALATGSLSADDPATCLRLDPVVLQADLSRVLLMRSGFAGFPSQYQQQVTKAVQEILAAENLTLQDSAEGWWTLKLPEPPAVTFTSLDDALGADVSDCLPEGPAAVFWKRLNNEIQMALHASEANQQRRQQGEAVINSVWFWGAGSLPKATRKTRFDRVFSDDPVSRGLACLQNIPLQRLEDLPADGALMGTQKAASVLVDWAVATAAASTSVPMTPQRLEQFVDGLIGQLQKYGSRIWLHSPEQSWNLQRRDLWRFWKQARPLAQQLSALQQRP